MDTSFSLISISLPKPLARHEIKIRLECVFKKGIEKTVIIVLVIAVLIGAGVLGYMIIKPLLTAPAPTPVIIPSEEVLPPVELPPAAPGVEEEVPPSAAVAHTSFFTLAADKTDSLETNTLAQRKQHDPLPIL